MKKIFTFGLLLWLATLPALSASTAEQRDSRFKDGDIIFHSSSSDQSQAIHLATNSIYNHVGLIFYLNDKPMVLETLSTVRYTPLADWIRRGTSGHYVVKRLANAGTLLTTTKSKELHKQARRHLNKPYDVYFEWSDNKLYCSELVWKAYFQTLGLKIGELKPLRSYNITHPIVAHKLRERYGQKIPLNSLMISPGALFDSPLLTTIATEIK